MSAPTNIEIAWGGGRWNKGHRLAVQPTVEAALGIAEDSMSYLDLEYTQPKQATIWRAANRFEEAGAAIDVTQMELYIPCQLIRYRKVQRCINQLAVVATHELMHMVRSERVEPETISDFAVSEGLAYYAEKGIVRELLRPDEQSERLATLERGLDDHAFARLRKAFYKDTLRDESDRGIRETDASLKLFNEWFGSPLTDEGRAPGDYIGIYAVGNMMQDGASLAEIVELPSRTVLGYDV